jgi:tetratricopeptide (TPR) repeat protein
VQELVLEFARAEHAGDPYAFRFEPQQYLLRRSGGGFETAEFPWDSALLDDLTALQTPGCDRVVVQRIGERLRRFVMPLQITEELERIAAIPRDGERVMITVRSAAAELYALPWELLTAKASGQHLGALPHVLYRYEWPQTHTTQQAKRPRVDPGRILFAWSAAAGSVPMGEQLLAIRAACRQGQFPFDEQRDVLASVSCSKLVSALEEARVQQQPISVLHILCHGGQAGSTFGLVLHGEELQDTEVVDAGTLRQVLAPFADMVRLIVLSACDSGNTGPLGNQLGSVAQTLHRAGFACVIASRNPLAVTASIKLTETLYQQLLCDTQSVELSLMSVRNRLLQSGTGLDWLSLQLYARSEEGTNSRPIVFRPYRGLLAFQPQHHRYFFGREQEVAQIRQALRSLQDQRKPVFLIVAGTSGTGKSSVVLAGVVPQLTSDSQRVYRTVCLKPGSDPLRALSTAMTGHEQTLGPLVLIVDQLEEIFTHVHDLSVRSAFLQQLWKLSQTDQVAVIVTLRVDFLSDCGDILLETESPHRKLDQIVYDEAHRVFIAQLRSDQIRATIEGPAARVGLTLEAGLTSRMIEAVGTETGALPILQHTLDLLWLHREGNVLTQHSYDELGQLAGALSQHADALLEKLSDVDQKIARRLLVRLVQLGDGVQRATRQRVPIERLRPASADSQVRFSHVLTELVNARLLTQSEEDKQPTIEIAHEALIRKWPRFAQWLETDREMLAMMLKLDAMMLQHLQHRVLWMGAQLHFAERCVHDYPDDTPEQAKAILRKSQRAQRQDRAIKRSVISVMILGAIFYAGYALYERAANVRVEQARKRLAAVIQHTSKNPTQAELLGTLARLRFELELSAPLALEVNQRALELAPDSPQLLADQAEFLLASGRFAEVAAIAQRVFDLQLRPSKERLRSAVLAWSAARFLTRADDQLQWEKFLLSEYQGLPPETDLEAMVGTSNILLRDQHQLRKTLPLSDVLAVHSLVSGRKSAAQEKRLREALSRSLSWSQQ